MRNPLKRRLRDETKPTLRERAAALKATAGRVMRRTKPPSSAEAVAAMAEHRPEMIPYPLGAPTHLLAVDLVIRSEAARLLDLAEAEFDRRYEELAECLGEAERKRAIDRLERELRMNALAEAAADADPLPPIDWHKPPAGYMAHPAIEPFGFLDIAEALPLEAARLHGIAVAEFERCREAYRPAFPGPSETDWDASLRRSLRVDAWAAVASPERAEPASSNLSEPGFVLYEDTAGLTRRKPVATWIAYMAARLYHVARAEEARAFNVALASEPDQDANALYDRMRRDLRVDALFDLAFRWPEVFEASREYGVGDRWRNGRGDATDLDAELVALGAEMDAAFARQAEADGDCEARADAATAAMPERPTCLIFRASDHPFSLRELHSDPGVLDGSEIDHGDIAWMRSKPRVHQVLRDPRPGERGWRDYGGKVPEMQQWPEAQARVDEILAAWDAWQAARRAVDAAHGVVEAEARCSEIGRMMPDLWGRMATLPAHTAEGLRAKLRAIRFMVECSTMGSAPSAVLRSLLRDAGLPDVEPEAEA